jgi:hypothetical protein
LRLPRDEQNRHRSLLHVEQIMLPQYRARAGDKLPVAQSGHPIAQGHRNVVGTFAPTQLSVPLD